MPESKTHQRFRSRAEGLEMYLEAMDAAARMAFNYLGQKKNQGKDIATALPINCNNYSRLNHPSSHRSRVYNFCRSKNTLSAIVEIFSYFSEYMRGILKEMYEHNPMLVVGKSNKPLNLTFAEISKFNHLSEIQEKMVEDVFRSIENERSTVKLIDKIISDTGANVSNADKQCVLPYLEMRHLIIHNHSKIDQAFEAKYGHQFSVRAGEKLPSKFEIADKAIEEVSLFLRKLDGELVRLGMVSV
ncbi:hypothetical protein [Chromohalobacter sp.]|uniref:hypothetical protein n=1 Tax=Chromohalobacter sp. TaxID=50740 RepID=UPI001DD1DC35|nr:hypothetical protein [Chromohalobacter sp.]NQY45213.1 hypothetical protein [Chromohalobacter sp.]